MGDLLLHAIENRHIVPGLDTDELIQSVSLLANLLFWLKAQQNQLAVFPVTLA
jgi:hypothetical protein